MDILLDVKILIASQDEHLWLKMILWDVEFATYAYSLTGINQYKLLFNLQHQKGSCIEYLLCQKYHREGGPAIIYSNGTQSWWYQGKRHREDGPAIIWANGDQQWWYQGNFIEKMDPQSFALMVRNIGIIKDNVIEKINPQSFTLMVLKNGGSREDSLLRRLSRKLICCANKLIKVTKQQ